MTEIVQALAALDAGPHTPEALDPITALCRDAALRGDKDAEAARKALDDFCRRLRERGDYELVIQLLDMQLSSGLAGPRQADLLLEKAHLLADDLLRDHDAEAAFRAVLQVQPGHDDAEVALEEMEQVRANWQKIVKKFIDEAKASTDRQLTTGLYTKVGEYFARFSPGSYEAETYWQKALSVEPRNRRASQHLERVLRAAARYQDLARLYEARADTAATKEERVITLLSLAELNLQHLGRPEAAVEAHKKALTIDPGNARALSALVALYTEKGDYHALIKLYEQALKARQRTESEIATVLQIGRLYWHKLKSYEQADEFYKRVRKADPAHPEMLDFYRDFYGGRGGTPTADDSTKLLQVLTQAQKVEHDPARRLALGCEMAKVAESAPGGLDKAIDIWKSVLKLDPKNGDAVAALKRLYHRTEKWNALLEMLKEQADALSKDDPAQLAERIERLLEVVTIYRDRLRLDVMVINTYNTILQLKPDHLGALDALAEKYEAMGRFNDLIGVLQRKADLLGERGAADPSLRAPKDQARLLKRVAQLWIDKFGNHNQAVRPLEDLYALDPADSETVARLRDIYNKRRSWRSLLDLERRELQMLEAHPERFPSAAALDAQRRTKLVELARLAQDRLGDAHEAIGLWNRLLELDPYEDTALTSLAALYDKEKRYPALIEILSRQRARTKDTKAQVALLERIGALLAEKLAAPALAVEVYREIVSLQPTHQKAMRTLRELYGLAGQYDELERLYGQLGQYDELCDVLMGLAERAPRPEEKLDVYARVARIAEDQLGSQERAQKAYERILQVDNGNLAAAQALVPIYQQSEKWPRLLSMYEVILSHAVSADGRLSLMRQIIDLCETRLLNKALAFGWAAKAYALHEHDPDTSPVRDELERELERLAQEADAWSDLVSIYASQTATLVDPPAPAIHERKVARLRQLARLSHSKLHRVNDARLYWEEVLRRLPHDNEALSALEAIFIAQDLHAELLGVYRLRVEAATDGARRVEVLFKVAALEEDKLHDRSTAAATYRRILSEPDARLSAQTTMRALRALEKIYQQSGDSESLAEVLERQLQQIEDQAQSRPLSKADLDTQIMVAFQLGEIYEQKLDRPERALTRYRQVLHLTSAHRPTLVALERFLAPDNPLRVEVARLLVPAYERADDARKLLHALEILLHATVDAQEELDLLRRLSALSRRLGEAEQAYRFSGRLFERVPFDGENRRELVELADLLDRQEDLARLLAEAEDRAHVAGDHALARDLAWELGQLYDHQLHQTDDAERAYLRVLERDESHEGAAHALEEIYRSSERFRELRQLLERRKDLALDNVDRKELLFQICDLDEGVLEDEEAATRDYAEILEIEPSNARAFKALERLHTAAERWRDLDELLARAVPHVDAAADRAQLRYRRGELHATRLDDPDGACELLEEALSEQPRHEGARRALEFLMANQGLRQRIARTLEPLFFEDGNWQKLVHVLRVQREALPQARSPEAAALMARIAGITEERLHQPEDALRDFRQALRLDPADVRNREHVERLATELGRFEDLAAAWEEAFLAADEDNLALRGELLRRAAELYDQQLGDPDRARDAWKRLLDLDPTSLDTARPAAVALARLYELGEQWGDLIDVLRRQAEWADPAERKEILFRVGMIQQDLLSDSGAAIATYREILEADPEEGRALDALERLHILSRQWTDLIEILRRRVELARDGQARRDLLWRIAEVIEHELHDQEEAISAYHVILDERAEDLPTLDALARLYEARERHGSLLEMLERRLPLTQHTTERVGLRVRMAALLEGPLHRLDAALECYREILDEDRVHAGARAGLERMLDDDELRLRAAEVLEPIYEGMADLPALVRICELFAAYVADLRERISRLKKVAELKTQLGEMHAAFDALARAARLGAAEQELPELLDLIEAHVARTGAKQDLVDLYRELAESILNPVMQERVLLTIAAEARGLGDRATAREYYRRVLDSAPDHPRALDALEQIYAEGRELDPLLEIYSRRAELAAAEGRRDPETRRHYLLLAAQLCEDELGRPEEAILSLEQVLQIFPGDVEAARALERLYKNGGRFADLADLLTRRLGFAETPDELVDLRYRLGGLFERELSDSDRAVENYREAIATDAAHGPSIAALERFLEDPAQRVAAAEVLKPVYEMRHDWQRLIRIYEIKLEAADDQARRVQFTRAIARLYEEQVGDLESAFTWYGRLFREEPGEPSTRDQLARLAGVLSSWRALAEVYQRYLDDQTGEPDPATLDVLRTAAAIYDQRLSEVDQAKDCYRRLLAADPNDAEAFSLLEAMLSRAGRWSDLRAVYREAADITLDLHRKKELLFKMSRLQEVHLGDAVAAIGTYREILSDVDADDEQATLALDRLYTALARFEDLAELLIARLGRAEGAVPERWIALKLRLGGLYERELSDLTRAIDSYEEVLERDDLNLEAVGALERLLGALEERDEKRFRIARILEPIYKTADEWEKLVGVFEAELLFIEDKPKRVGLLREIARLQELRGENVPAAFAALSRAWTEEAGEGEAREQPLYEELIRLCSKLGAWSEVVAIIERAAEGSYDYDLVARVHARVGEIQERHLHDRPRAISAWRRVTAVREDDVAAWRRLEHLLQAEERSEELAAVLEKRIALSHDTAEQKELLYRAARLYEEVLGQPERAVATWRQVLQLDEHDRSALQALARLYQARGAWRDLCWVYTQQIELAQTDAERRPLRFAMARVYEEELGDSFEAITAYKGALEENSRDADALGALCRLYEKEGQWADHLEALDRLAELREAPADTAERLALQLRAARVTEEKIHEPDGAIRRYQQVLEFEPPRSLPQEADVWTSAANVELSMAFDRDQVRILATQDQARSALERLVRLPETREAAAEVLEPIYRRRDEWRPLADLLELRLTGEADPTERRGLLSQIAAIFEQGLRDPQAAFATWGRILAEEPGDAEAVAELERLAEARRAFPELARLFEERLDLSADPEVQRGFALKLAVLYETRLHDDALAIDRYRRVLELPGEEMPALSALDRLLTRGGATSELADVLEREAKVAEDPAEQADFLYRLGELRAGQLDDLDGALVAFRDALERNPQHAEARAAVEQLIASPAHALQALALLEPLAEQERDFGKLVDLLEVRVGVTQGKAERAGIFERMARLCETELADASRAFEAMARAFSEAPEEARLADEMERLARLCSRDSDAASALESVLSGDAPGLLDGATLDSAILRDLGLRAARIWERLSESQRAEGRYQAVLELEPEDQDALRALERLYRNRGDVVLLAETLLRRAQLEADAGQKKEILSEAARLYEGPLGDDDKAIEAWKRVLDVEEGDRRALSALAGLYERMRRWEDLVAVLEAQAKASPDVAQQAQLKGRVAELLSDELDDTDRAIKAYRELLDLQPGSLKALTALEGLYVRAERWPEVQEILTRRLEAVAQAKDRIPIFRKLANLSVERMGAPEEAIGYLQQILDVNPADEGAQKDLERLLEQTEKWYDLVEVLVRHADAAAKARRGDEEVALLIRAAEIWERKLESPDAATELLERVLSRDPNNVRAMITLARIYEGQRDLERCKATLERAVRLARSGAETADLYYRLGRLEAERQGEGAAEPYYERALQADPTHLEVAEALEKLARGRGDFRRVAALLAVRAERMQSVDPARQRDLLLELGRLYVNELKSPEGALPVLERAHRLAPDDVQVIEPLADLYFAAGRLREALPLYKALVERTGRGRRTKELGRYHFRLGAIAERQGDVHTALEQYNAAYKVDAGHLPTLIALGKLYMQQARWEEARRIYRSMLLQNPDPSVGVTRADVYLYLGEIHEKLGEGPKAVGMYERGLELDPNHQGLLMAMGRVRA
jgi:tetratricopeptide (TPR) repeat protein